VYIKGQNDSCGCNIIVGFAEEKIDGLRQNVDFQPKKWAGKE